VSCELLRLYRAAATNSSAAQPATIPAAAPGPIENDEFGVGPGSEGLGSGADEGSGAGAGAGARDGVGSRPRSCKRIRNECLEIHVSYLFLSIFCGTRVPCGFLYSKF
jgi:hypothetical protein